MRVINFVMIPAMGFSMATSTVVSQNIGAGKIDRAERTNWVAVADVVPGARRASAFRFSSGPGR